MRNLLAIAMLPLAASVSFSATQALAAPAPASPAAAPAAPASAYSVETTELGTLLDDPAAKAVLNKHVPDIISSEQIDMARTMTLKQLQQYAGDRLTDEKVALIQADLDKLAKK